MQHLNVLLRKKSYKKQSLQFIDATTDRYIKDSMSEQSWLNAGFWSIPLRSFTIFSKQIIQQIIFSWIILLVQLDE